MFQILSQSMRSKSRIGDSYDMLDGITSRPLSGVSYKADELEFPDPKDIYNELGGEMIESLPRLPQRAYSSYDRQLRATPAPASFKQRPQSNSYNDDENYDVDDSAGMPSHAFFRKSYSLPLSRSGRSGGQWRHIKQATGQTGSNLLFIEGTVKDHDVSSFPPYGILQPEVRYNKLGQRLLPRRSASNYTNRRNEFNARAKAGFQYWYNEPKSNISQPPNQPFRTISGHQFVTKGVGFYR
ncbi:hypothetical protein EB796_014296 [Bugula neritina]|uniref:Uncharacterized protein n=1 Tax=Bugula neritina TaxID=10212 RepID=A0A7J7JPP7_BUGNE|nr:hypothetical protein EB796_014296 [Bugula neritina]